MNVVGLDIGGANLKIADAHGYVRLRAFALWKSPETLSAEIEAMLRAAPAHEAVGITMTGELADCFLTKRQGAAFILNAVSQVTDREVYVYLADGGFKDVESAKREFVLAAASNWHALGNYAARLTEGPAILVDIGSTTTDVIPLDHNTVAALGRTDYQRLVNRELVYTGVQRSSVSGIVNQLEHRGKCCPVMNELFATTVDVYALLGKIEFDTNNTLTADGRGLTQDHCVTRLARMIGKDIDDISVDEAIELAEQIRQAQFQQIAEAIQTVAARFNNERAPIQLVACGQGEMLVAEIADQLKFGFDLPVALLSDLGARPISLCAPAFAVAVLLRERLEKSAVEHIVGPVH